MEVKDEAVKLSVLNMAMLFDEVRSSLALVKAVVLYCGCVVAGQWEGLQGNKAEQCSYSRGMRKPAAMLDHVAVELKVELAAV